MTPFAARAAIAIAQLKADIEALATEVRLSATALNDYGDPHFVIQNGAVKPEGEAGVPWPGLQEACAATLATAATLSAHHKGDHVVLFWRVLPEWEMGPEQPNIYARLSFAINPPMAAHDPYADKSLRPGLNEPGKYAQAQIAEDLNEESLARVMREVVDAQRSGVRIFAPRGTWDAVAPALEADAGPNDS